MLKTEVYYTNRCGINKVLARVVKVLGSGGLVVYPTETVYGLAADPEKRKALRRIYALKGRALGKSLPIQVGSISGARSLVKNSALFDKCARHFWPGPVTLVSARARGKGTVGIRIPRHKLALRILNTYKRPLAVTSANLSGERELWKTEDLIRFFDGRVEIILIGKSRPGKASTVIDLTGKKPVILRKGPIKEADIKRVGIS